MFKLFKKKSSAHPPTATQLRRAKSLKIKSPESMNEIELAHAIADIEDKKLYGEKTVDLRTQWQQINEDAGFILAAYKHKKETIIDVLSIHGVYINEKGKLRLDVCTPQYDRDKTYGSRIVWDQFLDIPVEAILYHEPLQRDFARLGSRAYKKTVKRGLRTAKNLLKE